METTPDKGNESIWDVIVIGGGPAGMMAAGTAAEKGAKVLLIEKNDTLGKKLLITGGGRCNVTNAELDDRKLLEKFRNVGKFLFSAFSQWSVKETLEFFNMRGMETKIENELRAFPVSNKAQSVWDVLVKRLKDARVSVRSNCAVTGLVHEAGLVTGVTVDSGSVIRGRNVIVATGGVSRPETGSTGDGYEWMRAVGHSVIDPKPSLVPVALKDAWVKRLAGVTLSNIKITLLQNGEKQGVNKGRILFTHVGVSGPTVLNMSKDVGELLKYGDVLMALDLLPTQDHGVLNANLQKLFDENGKKKFKNAIGELVSPSIAPIVIELSGIDADSKVAEVNRESRLKLVSILKGIPLHVDRLLGTDKAIITSGGVLLDQIDFKTMRSRIVPNLYIIGDMLNIDRPSGGYSLQLCWTTGFVAGSSAADQI